MKVAIYTIISNWQVVNLTLSMIENANGNSVTRDMFLFVG